MEMRMTAVEEAAERHEQWHEHIGARMVSFEAKLDENTKTTARIEEGTAELLELLHSWKGAMRVIGWISKPAVLLASFVAALTTAYFAIWPKK